MPYWQLFLILQLGMCALYLWGQEVSMFFYRRWQRKNSLTAWSVSVGLESASILCGTIALITLPITPILYLLSSRIGPSPW